MTTIFVSAGEASGDMHAAALIRELKARNSGLRFFGLGGELMRAEGVELLHDLKSLAVAGFWEVAKRIFSFRKIYKSTLKKIDEVNPVAAILVDYPGMNLRLANELKKRGCKVFYYIVPQVWAWKAGRIKQIERDVDLLLSILPFEKELFDPAKIKVEYVGHPLLDIIPANHPASSFRKQTGIANDERLIALLPGSRVTEISRHYPIMLQTVKLLDERGYKVSSAAVIRDEIPQDLYENAENRIGVTPLKVSDLRYSLLREADVSLVSSGTATLEAALCGRPFCVVYQTGWITYQIAKRLILLDRVGLVNIIAGEKVVPEFLQSELSAKRLANFCALQFDKPELKHEMIAKLGGVRGKLGEPGSAARAADSILRELSQ